MPKIRLPLEALDVQSFVTAAPDGARGTVQGAQSEVEGPATDSQPPRCWVESGDCADSRYDIACNTLYCGVDTRDCPLDTAPPAC